MATSTTTSTSTSKNVLNEELLSTILAGLTGNMTDDEITAYAESLLKPQLNAEIEASQQEYEASKLGYEQEIENLAVQLADSIDKQKSTFTQNLAGLETSALSRGMGRSSYLLDTEAALSQALSETIRQLSDENTRQTAQIQNKLTLAGQQAAQTQGRLNTDYATQLAAKIQELKDTQRQEYNQNYLSAVSAAMGSQTDSTSTTQTDSGTSSGGGSGGGSSKKSTTDETSSPEVSTTLPKTTTGYTFGGGGSKLTTNSNLYR